MKKVILSMLLALATTAAYADGSVNVDVTDNIPMAEWHTDGGNLHSYQFNNKTNKAMKIYVTIKPEYHGQLAIYCLDKGQQSAPTQEISPGVPFTCTASDVIKMSADSQVFSGQYSIELVDVKK